MAAGVPETDVFAAADAVLARGERVRIELGRGSPARVGQLLEQWWEQLAQRLKGHALLPELPGEVAQAFAEAWRLALIHAEVAAQVAVTEKHNALSARETALTQERKVWEIALTEAQANTSDATSQLTQAHAQLRERQALIEQIVSQVADARQQRDHRDGQLSQRQSELAALRVELAGLRAHGREVEDRAHQQVDKACQDLKSLEQQQGRMRKELTQQIAELIRQRDALQAAARTAEQTSAHQAGRITALESAILQWRSVQASALKRGGIQARPGLESCGQESAQNCSSSMTDGLI